jgi:hypothetical protein
MSVIRGLSRCLSSGVYLMSVIRGLSRCFGMLLLVPSWEIFSRPIGHFGIKITGVRMKILGILHDFRIFFVGRP